MLNTNLRQRLLANETLVGTLISIPSPEIVELLSMVGFDWLFLDAEHGAFGPNEIISLLQAASDTPCLVRIPGADPAWIKKVLDAGATGIIVPQVESKQQAQAVVQAAKYPPQGRRGVGLGRAHKYGIEFSEYLSSANDNTIIVLQAESQKAVDNIDEIAAVDGLDAVLIGPYDLSASLGHTGDIQHSIVQTAIKEIANACQKQNTKLGIFGISAENVSPYKALGFSLLTVGVDTLFIEKEARNALQAIQRS
jgi:2-keto-3-deoxy-L-rhamnonate aldolase RhmA